MIQELEVIYASNPADQRALYCWRLHHYSFGYFRIAQSYYDVDVTEEDGNVYTYKRSSLGVDLAEKDATGRQDLNFELPNVDGEPYEVIEKIRAAQRERREPVVSDLLIYNNLDKAVVAEKLSMRVVNASSTIDSISVRCSYFDMLNAQWPTRRYTIDEFPGLEYV